MKRVIFRLILGIIIILATIVGAFFLCDGLLNVHQVLFLKWFPLMSSFIGFFLAGLVTRSIKMSWLPILFVSLWIFEYMFLLYFPLILLIILSACLGLLLSRNRLQKKMKLALWLFAISFHTYFLLSQPLIIEQEMFGIRTDGALVNAKKIWDFSKKEPNKLASEVFLDSNNKEVYLSQFEGSVLYIDIWATWCKPCLEEKPMIDSLKKTFSTNEKIVFVDISIDHDKDAWKSFIDKESPKGIQLISKEISNTRRNFEIISLPHHIIVNAKQYYRSLGHIPAAERYLNDMEALDQWISEEQIIIEKLD